MQLARVLSWSVLCVFLGSACGPKVEEAADPQSWMQGWFSIRHPSDSLIEVSDTQLHLEADGVALFRAVEECGSFESTWTMLWEPVDASAVRIIEDDVLDYNPFGFDRTFMLRRVDGCDAFELSRSAEDSDVESSVGPMHAGQICLVRGEENSECHGSGCVVCYKQWCEGEEPPATCEDGAG